MRAGDLVWVRWSTWGLQLAVLLPDSPRQRRGTVRVRKYRRNSHRWTAKPVTALIDSVRLVTEDERAETWVAEAVGLFLQEASDAPRG
jgi:hypothetical protein